MQATRVLVVEDDANLRAMLVRGLRDAAFDAVAVPDGGAALQQLAGPGERVDVVVLDIGLPDADGRDVCQAMRARGITAPVLFLTARGQVGDLLSGFAAGGDDYLAKPFNFAELLARLTALARRAGMPQPTAKPSAAAHLDPRTHALVAGSEEVPLTPTEYRILATLLADPARVVRRGELIAAAWPAGAIVAHNTLDQYVARIRRKLAELPGTPELTTVHGVGYRLS